MLIIIIIIIISATLTYYLVIKPLFKNEKSYYTNGFEEFFLAIVDLVIKSAIGFIPFIFIFLVVVYLFSLMDLLPN